MAARSGQAIDCAPPQPESTWHMQVADMDGVKSQDCLSVECLRMDVQYAPQDEYNGIKSDVSQLIARTR
jgi:hypothetical protein